MDAVGAQPSSSRIAPHLFSADRPITSKVDDLLARTPFAQNLASAIEGWREKDSLVIALYGPWGSGKTSLKNLTLETLEQRKSTTIVEFDPWQWSGQDQIAQAFFEQVGTALGKTDTSREGVRRVAKWRQYAAYLQVGAEALGGIRGIIVALLASAGVIGLSALAPPVWFRVILALLGALALLAAAVLAWSSRIAEAWSQAIARREETRRKSLEEVRDELRASLMGLSKPLLVVIDDIDRLTAEEMRIVFQLVKANADFPNLVYLLLFERKVIEGALEDSGISGSDYLEKIVQVGFDVPEAERSRLHRVLFKELDELLGLPGMVRRWDSQRWARLFWEGIHPSIRTLRHVRRFVGMFSFQVSLLRQDDGLEVNPIDLIGLETLRTFQPALYAALPSSKKALTDLSPGLAGSAFAGRDREADARRAVLRSMVETAEERHRPAVESILKELFPTAGWAFGEPAYATREDSWVRDIRVCVPEIFDRYFLLAIPQGDISQAQLERLLAAVNQREAFVDQLRSLQAQGLLETALERLGRYTGEIALEHAVPFTTALFDIGDDLSHEAGGFIALSPLARAGLLIRHLLQREPEKGARAAVLQEALKATNGLSLPVLTVAREGGRQEDSPESTVLEKDDLPALEELCLEKIRKAAASKQLLGHPMVLSFLFQWAKWAPDEPREWASRLIASHERLLGFLRGSLTRVRSVGAGDYLPVDSYVFRLKEIGEFADVDEVSRAVEQLPEEELSPEDVEAVQAFRRALQRRAQGKSDDDWDDE